MRRYWQIACARPLDKELRTRPSVCPLRGRLYHNWLRRPVRVNRVLSSISRLPRVMRFEKLVVIQPKATSLKPVKANSLDSTFKAGRITGTRSKTLVKF